MNPEQGKSLCGADETFTQESYRWLKEQLVRRSQEVRVFADSSALLTSLPPTENLYESICYYLTRIVGVEMAWLGILAEGSAIATPVAQSDGGGDEGSVGFVWKAATEAGPERSALEARKALVINDSATAGSTRTELERLAQQGYASAMLLPLFFQDGRVMGSLNLYSRETGFFGLERGELFQLFANYSACIIENRLIVEGLEKSVRERTLLLEEARLTAVAANGIKSDFLANMSHELRTPLNSIIGFSEVLTDELYGRLNDKQREYVGNILGSGRHLLSLINDILDLSKVEAGKLELELSTFLLKDLLNSTLCMFKEKAMKHTLNLELEIEPGAEGMIEADERKLKQIMFNLLSNAVKFTPDGGSVKVAAKRVQGSRFEVHGCEENIEHRTLNLEQDGNFVEISVSDSGIGIKPENICKLFTPFTQFESAYSKNFQGTGLGLALTKQLVELHGGSIRAESEFGGGSRFTFVIPAQGEQP